MRLRLPLRPACVFVAMAAASLAALPAGPARAQTAMEWITLDVALPEKDLSVRREVLPDQTVITHVEWLGSEPAGSAWEPGHPKLPYFTQLVALPRGAKIVSVEAKPGQPRTFSGAGLVAWAQPDRPGRDPSGPPPDEDRVSPVYFPNPPVAGLDPLFQQVSVWPRALAEIVETSEMAGYQVAKIRTHPVQWQPREQNLLFFPIIVVGVGYTGGSVPPRSKGYGSAMAADELKTLVANPEFIPDVLIPKLPEELDAWHLIITDNFRWNADITKGAALSGDMIAEFERLSEWKTQKGVKSAVVTVSDIVDGRYGSFTGGARDLQEVLRNFLKHARSNWNTYWVLLGGDVEIIPPREAVAHTGHDSHYLKREAAAKPEENRCYWDEAADTVRIHHDGYIDPMMKISSRQTGRVFSKVAAPSAASPGWAYATNDNYTTISAAQTDFIILRGPLADTQNKDFYAVMYKNTIPTDLYYASLVGPGYNLPGLHDWDKNNNGLYGQYFDETALDGVDYAADLALGRAPVASGAQAQAFVDKVLAYERYDDLPLSFARRLLLGAANWSKASKAVASTDNPPDEKEYYSAAGSTTAKLHFEEAPSFEGGWRLVAWNAAGDWWTVPYNRNAGPAVLGYYYCTNGTYATRSEWSFNFWGINLDIPIPTKYVKVLGPSGNIHPASYFFDSLEPDLSVKEKELLKTQFAGDTPEMDLRKRLYQDILDTPGYPDPDLFELTQDDMRAALNTGYNFVSLTGHGNSGGCCGVSDSWVDELTNGFKGGVVYADSCSTCEFNVNDAVCEVFLKTPTGGAAGYVGNSRYSWVGPGAYLERAFWHRLTTDRHLGRLHNTKASLADSNAHRWAQYALNLMGDPEMPLWLGSPAALKVTHPSSVVKGNSFIVKVTTTGGAPITFARVCLTGPRDIFELHYTGVTGETEFFTSDKQAGDELLVTVTKEDYIPYQGTVDVTLALKGFIRGDANLDKVIDLSDALTIFGVLFLGQGRLPCPDGADANDDGQVDLSDGVKVLSVLFLGDRLPPGTIFGEPQEDPTPDRLDC